MTSQLKTLLLLALLSGLIIVLGGLVGGRTGVIIAFGFAMLMNVGSYWYSDSIVLRMYGAREVSYEEAPMLHQIVEELARNAGIPKPKVCIVPEQAPNAFATGRDPEHAVVAATEGILQILTPRELRGVLAHEVAHIAHRDILIQTVAAVMGSTIVMLANILQFASFFGGAQNEEGERTNPVAGLLMAILAPIAATLIQMAISRSREYLADAGGASYCNDPLSLASALNKLQIASGQIPMRRGNPTTAEMFIVTPLFGGSMANLFSTHPPMDERIGRLEEMARQNGQAPQTYSQPASQFVQPRTYGDQAGRNASQFGDQSSSSRGGDNGHHFGDL